MTTQQDEQEEEDQVLLSLAKTIFWPFNAQEAGSQRGVLIGYQVDGNVFCVADVLRSYEEAVKACHRLHQCEILGDLLVDDPNESSSDVTTTTKHFDDDHAHGSFRVLLLARTQHPSNHHKPKQKLCDHGVMQLTPRVHFYGESQGNCHVNFVLFDPQELDACRFIQTPSAVSSPVEQALVQLKTHFKEVQLTKDHSQPSCCSIQRHVWNLVEFVGYYMMYLPSLLGFTIVSKLACLFSVQIPTWVPLLRGKCIKDFSTTFALIEYKLVTMASLPRRLHDLYHHQPARYAPELVEVLNTTVYMTIDLLLGWFFYQYFLQAYLSPTRISSLVEAGCEMLHERVVWLMGAPAGFKLNLPLATVLGNGILLWIELWEFLLQNTLLQPRLLLFVEQFGATHWGLFLFGGVSLSVQLTLLSDLLTWCTWQTFAVYKYFAKVNALQFNLLSSLWKLFWGKKKNVLRQRVDSREYDVSQLLLGTLLFTILSFLITTTTVFYVSFSLVRFSIFLVQVGCWLPVVALRVMPYYTLLLWLVTAPQAFTSHIQFRLVPRQPKSCQFAIDAIDTSKTDSEMDQIKFCFQRMHTANIKHLDPPSSSQESVACNPMISLQLVLVKCSMTILFGKWKQYFGAFAKRYTASCVVQTVLWGIPIETVPFGILFEDFDTLCSRLQLSSQSSTASAPLKRMSKEKTE